MKLGADDQALGWLKFLSPSTLVLKFALKKPISHLMAYFRVEMGVLEDC